MNKTKQLNRNVTKKECPWLDDDLKKGTIVYVYYGATYGCINPLGIAVTKEEDKTPFFEVPLDCLDEITLHEEGKEVDKS